MDLQEKLRGYVEQFNRDDDETIVNEVSNAQAGGWLRERVPRIAVPDAEIERTYYFRWWTYRKHIRRTPEGHVLSEFNTVKELPWSKKYNAIACAAGHHVDEGRWLRENAFLDDYIRFWYDGDTASLHRYGNWLEAAVSGLCRLRGDWSLGGAVLDRMLESWVYLEQTQLHDCGAVYSIDDRDGQEYSVGGSGFRPTMNSYMYGGAKGIAEIARMTGKSTLAREYENKAARLAAAADPLLWDEAARFYKTRPLDAMRHDVWIPPVRPPHMDAREICGFFPWRFHMAPAGREDAFRQLLDPEGFFGKVNATTCERRHTDYLVTTDERVFDAWMRRYDRSPYNFGKDPAKDEEFRRKKLRGDWLYNGPYGVHMHGCQWNGPSWAYSTSLMLGAAAALLADYPPQSAFTKADYLLLLHRYAASHKRVTEDGRTVSWADEAQDPDTGEWMTRKVYYERRRTIPGIEFPYGIDRGKDYNHSSFCDLVLDGLFGVRPTAESIRVVPLFPAEWPYALLEDVRVHGKCLDVRYTREDGYTVKLDGETAFRAAAPEPCELPG